LRNKGRKIPTFSLITTVINWRVTQPNSSTGNPTTLPPSLSFHDHPSFCLLFVHGDRQKLTASPQQQATT